MDTRQDAKFKVGDWVRVTDQKMVEHWNKDWAGKADFVAEIGSAFKISKLWPDSMAEQGGYYNMVAGAVSNGPWWYGTQIEPWTPRVGERVRYKRSGEIVPVIEMRSDGRVVVQTRSFGACTELLASVEPIIDAVPSAPFKIEVGKFYKTRDGRKVGPMQSFLSDRLVANVGDGNIWMVDGKAGVENFDKTDLVAEWPATAPAQTTAPANVGATVDAINEEYGPVVAAPTATPKFKVGDLVVVLDNTDNGGRPIEKYEIGRKYAITSVVKDLNGKDAALLNGHYQYLKQGQFSTPTTAIVCLLDDGKPAPANRPAVHTSVESAEREAKRLADVHKGQTFGVFTLGATHKMDRVYGHEWQRQAANGNRIGAIKELIAVAGLPMGFASSAVEHFIAAA